MKVKKKTKIKIEEKKKLTRHLLDIKHDEPNMQSDMLVFDEEDEQHLDDYLMGSSFRALD